MRLLATPFWLRYVFTASARLVLTFDSQFFFELLLLLVHLVADKGTCACTYGSTYGSSDTGAFASAYKSAYAGAYSTAATGTYQGTFAGVGHITA